MRFGLLHEDTPVVERGTAYPVGDLGFFLASDDTESGGPDVPAEVLPQDIRPDRPVLTLRVLYGAGEGTPSQPAGP